MDQQSHWNQKHSSRGLEITEVSKDAKELLPKLAGKKTLLELGTGNGFDANYFAENGLQVLATDFAETAIAENKKLFTTTKNLDFKVLDTREIKNLLPQQFDVIYARLSLHYFTDQETKLIFPAIHELLAPQGLLFFVCKSTDDPLYGQGEHLEQDMFMLAGHVRHFFSEAYARELLANKFQIVNLQMGAEVFYGKRSNFIKVLAGKL